MVHTHKNKVRRQVWPVRDPLNFQTSSNRCTTPDRLCFAPTRLGRGEIQNATVLSSISCVAGRGTFIKYSKMDQTAAQTEVQCNHRSNEVACFGSTLLRASNIAAQASTSTPAQCPTAITSPLQPITLTMNHMLTSLNLEPRTLHMKRKMCQACLGKSAKYTLQQTSHVPPVPSPRVSVGELKQRIFFNTSQHMFGVL